MTCVATDGKTMAGDGLCSAGGLVTSRSFPKVFRLSDGRVVGMAGTVADMVAVRAWLEDPDREPPAPEDPENLVDGVILTTDGSVFAFEGTHHAYAVEVPYAVGSGRDAAMAALRLGRSPRQAIQLAATMFTNVGGRILDLAPGAADAE